MKLFYGDRVRLTGGAIPELNGLIATVIGLEILDNPSSDDLEVTYRLCVDGVGAYYQGTGLCLRAGTYELVESPGDAVWKDVVKLKT